MSKNKITFVRSQDFESIDDELTQALSLLDQANDRVVNVLESAPPPITAETSTASELPTETQEPGALNR